MVSAGDVVLEGLLGRRTIVQSEVSDQMVKFFWRPGLIG